LIVLGDASVKFQGTWADLAHKSGISTDTIIPQPENPNHQTQLEVDSTIRNQTLKVADAVSDLSRATGDLSLYCRSNHRLIPLNSGCDNSDLLKKLITFKLSATEISSYS
jgi:hypothetical protein